MVQEIDPEFIFLDIPRYIIKVNLPFGYVAFRREGRDVQIYRLRVKPEYRGKGVGTELLGSITCNGKIFIIVHELNLHFDWLLNRGFHGTRILFNHFPDKRDGYVFEKVC